MTPTLLVLLLLSQAERPDDPPAGAMKPPFPASLRLGGGAPGAGWVRREDWGQLVRALEFPAPDGTLRPGAFASVGLGVDHAR